MDKILCPFCGKSPQTSPIKVWRYSNREVSRYKCHCGKFYNFLKGTKSSWTIPKPKPKLQKPKKSTKSSES